MLRNLTKVNSKKIPGPVNLPFIGNLWRYKLGFEKQSKYEESLSALYQKYGPVVRRTLGTDTIIHVFNPKDASNIYSKEGKTPSIRPLQETIQIFRKKANVSLGLGNTNGEEWYKLRNALRPIMLTKSGIQHFTEGIDESTDDLIKKMKSKLKPNQPIPRMTLLFGAWTLDAAGLMCFGKKIGFLNENEHKAIPLLRANRSIFYLSTHLKFSSNIYKHIRVPKWTCLESSEKYLMTKIRGYTNEAIDRIMEALEKGTLKDDKHYMLQQLLSRDNLEKNDVHVLMQSLFTDSLSTIVPVLTFALYILSTHPHIQQRTYEEVSKFIPKDKPITINLLDNLPYTKGLIKETLRFYPNVTEISRILHQDFELSGYHIPANTHVHLNLGVNYYDEKEFENPLKVMPERWIRSENIRKPDPFVLIPFGHGARTCMGRRFAEQSLQIVIAKILHNFKLRYRDDAQPMDKIFNLLIHPSDTRGIILEPRN